MSLYRYLAILAFLVTPMLLPACSTQPSKQDDLRLTVQAYHGHLRWGRYTEAASFLPAAEQAEFIGRHDELGDTYRIVELELRSITFPRPNEAEVQIAMQWIREPDMTVYKDRITEIWHRTEEGWIVVKRQIESR